ncbi:oxidoreductase-like domain-containing protein [Pseudogulbenkiania subflava]|uniref:Oxidoreductase-like protein, N-terminal n=1 Tax=Pseudogulbenkiania subflava DSM 22618 TaxID=1123014 RepID=A0A1Y6BN67_9NEIS|nr:oxidoreductase-like domain-containing protein [Pseudogulbenkiania subflava]SMF20261.1 Oxidoreductase-like protein, N-terminal [Pseudogulbenkiania subflava DSM 22618]
MIDDDVFDPMPEAPIEPTDDMCCGSGCEPCVWDTYTAELNDYRRKLAEWQAREAARQAAAPQDGA